jgi:myosin-1
MEGLLSEEGIIGDLVLLEDVSETGIEKILNQRHAADHVYTYIGNVLISVNPFKNMPTLYSLDLIPKYRHRFAHEAPPHVFALAEVAYRQLPNGPQSTIICGESGAGKTEASKKIMQYIAAVSGGGPDIERIKDRLLKSNPVLEAFGNAKTLRNNNSSRFGKYLEIFFDFKGDPVGGRVQNYLLEKSRVVQPGVGERSFHIFYQLVKASSPSQKQKYFLRDVTNFRYLAQSNMFTLDEFGDEKDKDPDIREFTEVVDGMKSLNITEEEIDQVFCIIATVLWLGEIDFEPK